MGSFKRLLRSVSVQTAQRRRKCHHDPNRHAIAAGTRCLVEKDPASGNSRNYCPSCAGSILDRAELDLEALREALA